LVPGWATIFWDAGTVSDVPLVVQTWDQQNGTQAVLVFSRAEDHEVAKGYLDDLIGRAKGSESPYRGRLLKASWAMWGVQLDVLTDPFDSRRDLILPEEVWNALDLNVHRMFARMDTFRSAGLGSNRGVLLAGAPGTGKTAACRVLAAEVLGDVTVVFVDSRASQALLPQLYTEIAGMAPALVLLEDLDLVVGDRADGSARMALLDFLTVLDGLMTQHHDIITVATTNDPDAVDAGVRRAARFDQIVAFPVPDDEGRRRILDVYLRSVEHRVDTEVVAKAAQGRTGADLRECVRAALLVASGPIQTEDVLRAVGGRSNPDRDRPGSMSEVSNYL
jgi:SpoVK/Ycf46/Vps4 family AAA+-type ATPase